MNITRVGDDGTFDAVGACPIGPADNDNDDNDDDDEP